MGGIRAFYEYITPELREQSGSVFYSGDTAFSTKHGVYLLGINPGGRPENGKLPTIGEHVDAGFETPDWNSYLDEEWQRQKAKGTAPIQQRVQHLISGLRLDLRATPASNLIFVRTATERDLSARYRELADQCWPFHQAVIEKLEVKAVICFGASVGQYVRNRLGAHELRDSFTETNARAWKSNWYGSPAGPQVVVLNHPSRVDWQSINSDPTELVAKALRAGLG